MTAYYNEIDPFAAQWLRNLITAGHIAPGDVDERSIVDVQPDDLRRYTQCHFFAGIGGWSYAARLAGWPDDRALWTGSCPCQPFSTAGNRAGFSDDRHLWPTFFNLINQLRPVVVFGEQVASPDGIAWLDLVHDDLEGTGYACGAVVFPAAGVGAPHARHRTFFVAHPACEDDRKRGAEPDLRQEPKSGSCREQGDLADANRIKTVGPAISREEHLSWCREPAVARVADGVSYSLAQPAIRAFGNAIVPQVAAEVIGAYLDSDALLSGRAP